MTTLLTWPTCLPQALGGLYDDVARDLGAMDIHALGGLSELDDIASRRLHAKTLLVVPDAAVASGEASLEAVITGLDRVAGTSGLDLVMVVGDGYLGTDTADTGPTLAAAAAVAVVRSRSVRRGAPGRANVVCVPDAMFGRAATQRGPLAHEVELADVVHAVVLFLSDAGGYLNGQVLFVDGGRHLFSSMSA